MKTIDDLNSLFSEAYSDVAEANIPGLPPMQNIVFKYNQKIGGSWGRCQRKSIGHYVLSFSSVLCQHTTDNSILNTMAHELIHACGIHGHKRDFKLAGQRLMAKFPGKYNVARCTGAEEKMDFAQMVEAYKYIIGCPKCGMKWGYQRFSRHVQEADFCFCPRCEVPLERIK